MSFDFPFSKPAGWLPEKFVLVALLVVHIAWIITHLVLVTREQINPWKLGGYGMYTTVYSDPVLYVYDMRFSEFQLPTSAYSYDEFVQKNFGFTFRCRRFSEESLKDFFKASPQLVGVYLRFIVGELELMRNPIRAERVPQSVLEVRWTDPNTFLYAGQVCDELYNGEIKVKP